MPSTNVWRPTGGSSRSPIPISMKKSMAPGVLWSSEASSGFWNVESCATASLASTVPAVSTNTCWPSPARRDISVLPVKPSGWPPSSSGSPMRSWSRSITASMFVCLDHPPGAATGLPAGSPSTGRPGSMCLEDSTPVLSSRSRQGVGARSHRGHPELRRYAQFPSVMWSST